MKILRFGALLAGICLLPALLCTAQSPSAQPEFTTLKTAFVPGDKTIFYDDFTDMQPDSPPPHFKVRGASPELRAAGDLRQLTITQRGTIIPNLTNLPRNFTYEAEIKVDNVKRAISGLGLYAGDKQVFWFSASAMAGQCELQLQQKAPAYADMGRKRAAVNWNEPVKIAFWAQDGRIRAFVNGEKWLDFNQVEFPALTRAELAHDFYGVDQALSYRSVRFAESTPDFSQVIMSSGRYVTNGILFDTNSDRLKPDSAPVIQAIARGLAANASLKVLIEGHTDSTGNAAANLDLSKRRAEAVKSVLASQFQIDAGRMTTTGLGASKPVDNNDSPQGRARNRRVEFVKQ